MSPRKGHFLLVESVEVKVNLGGKSIWSWLFPDLQLLMARLQRNIALASLIPGPINAAFHQSRCSDQVSN